MADDLLPEGGRYRLFGPELRRWVFLALAIRLLLMPICGHYDLLYAYGYAARLIAGTISWAEVDADHSAYLLHTIVLKVLQPFVKTFLLSGGTVGIDQGTWGFWQAYARTPEIFRAFALFKLPYLGLDILSAWLILKIVGRDPRAIRPVKLWLFNPIIIFVTYMFGRFDIMAVPFFLASVLSLKHRKTALAAVLFGMCPAIRFYYILFVPAFAAISSSTRRDRVIVFLFALFPILFQTACLAAGVFPLAFLVVTPALALFLFAERFRRYEIAALAVSLAGAAILLLADSSSVEQTLSHSGFGMLGYAPHAEFPFRARLELWLNEAIYPVFVVYGLFLFWVIGLKRWRLGSSAVLFAIFLLGYYSFSFFHPQYLVALVAGVVLASTWQPRIAGYHILQCLLALVLVFNYGVHPTNYLFAPFAPEAVFSSTDLLTFVEAKLGPLGPKAIIGIPRSLFVAVSLWMAWLLFRQLREGGTGTV